MLEIKLAEMDCEKVADEIGDFVLEKVVSRGKNGVVLGLSGGVDSTTTAALIKKAFDKYNSEHNANLELVGYILPTKINSPADAEDGIKVAEKLGIRYEVQDLEPIVQAFGHTNPEALKSKYDKGNLISEIRAVVLHGKAATEKKMLSGTGNKDEDYGIGYYTLFGDGAVHMSPIGGLPKRLVREMASYLGFSDLADRVPSAGLEPGQTDFKDLGYSYDLVEVVCEGLDQGLSDEEVKRHPQVVAMAERDNADYAKAFGESKFKDVSSAVEDLLGRHYNSALQKVNIVSPDVAKISLKYGGK